MVRIQKLLIIALLIVLALPQVTHGQVKKGKKGNVVAYFGNEEKVSVHEGTVFHQFDKGLFVHSGAVYGREATPKDFLASKMMNGGLQDAADGLVAGTNYKGEELKWESIAVNKDGEFKDDRLKTGHLYLRFEAPKEMNVILEATGNTMSLVNGFPREGDHYNFGWSLVPFKLKKGTNEFLFTAGRFPGMKARLIEPNQAVLLTKRDITLPDLIIEEEGVKWGGLRIVNTSDRTIKGYALVSQLEGEKEVKTSVPAITPLNTRKVPFQVADIAGGNGEDKMVKLTLLDSRGKKVDAFEMKIHNRSTHKHHERTFISSMDGSVQYYSVAPSNNPSLENPAMFLSVHGASVQARNQARAYAQKDWGHLVAPTNRRPFGFAWEDWGRMDALEVLEDAEGIFKTDRKHTYLTGHSMGGHGSWYLGATYPDRFAAIAPCAGYPELMNYASSHRWYKHTVKKAGVDAVSEMFSRAGNPTKTKSLARNYLQQGVYIFHGDSDNVVDPAEARQMRELLGTFHNDFCHYEYPGGTHWFGNESVDWAPIFDYFKRHDIPETAEVKHLEFHTASPGVSASNHWITIQQQTSPLQFSSVTFDVEEGIKGTSENVETIVFHMDKLGKEKACNIEIDEQLIEGAEIKDGKIILSRVDGQWKSLANVNAAEKSPERNGGFKDAFRNQMVFVYSTKGKRAENEWYYNKARFDAETFWYRGNGSVEIIRDVDFALDKYKDRNVVIYGNASNNAAWKKLLGDSPIQVRNGAILMGKTEYKGDDLSCYFVRPRKDSDIASVGVVAGTGDKGMKATYANQYYLAGPGFPDLMIFNANMLTEGAEAVRCAGFFGNDWSVKKGEFVRN